MIERAHPGDRLLENEISLQMQAPLENMVDCLLPPTKIQI